ncbi:unnamed protein product [Pleuronectes platessa]|uniref:Uncharacterized protein n=1 Tax=Pleuronectes platessa TaxID=8262 RepID=A0A9N7TXS4_PLEPL|nr:unnamed protein product [Pleuronectes platessa]
MPMHTGESLGAHSPLSPLLRSIHNLASLTISELRPIIFSAASPQPRHHPHMGPESPAVTSRGAVSSALKQEPEESEPGSRGGAAESHCPGLTAQRRRRRQQRHGVNHPGVYVQH